MSNNFHWKSSFILHALKWKLSILIFKTYYVCALPHATWLVHKPLTSSRAYQNVPWNTDENRTILRKSNKFSITTCCHEKSSPEMESWLEYFSKATLRHSVWMNEFLLMCAIEISLSHYMITDLYHSHTHKIIKSRNLQKCTIILQIKTQYIYISQFHYLSICRWISILWSGLNED